MSFSLQPDQIMGIADRVRTALDEMLERSHAVHDAVDALSATLARVTPARAAFDDVMQTHVSLTRGMVSHGRAAVSVLRAVVMAYVTADEEMADTTAASEARAQQPLFDPSRFGARLS